MKRFLLSLPLILPITVFGQGLPDKPYIYVEGRAEIEKPADIVTLRFDVVGRAPDQPKANQDVQQKANKAFALLKDRKIADNDIIAESLTSEPEFEEEQNVTKKSKLVGYTITRRFELKIRDVTSLPMLINDLIAGPGAEIASIEGGLSKEKEVQNEIWEKAVANAREEAERTLKTMNMKIDGVFAVSPARYSEVETRIFGGNVTRLGVRASKAPPMAEEVGPQYLLAPVTLSQSAHVIYLISPAK